MKVETVDSGPQVLFDNQILTYDELSERLRVPKRTLKRYVAKGTIPCNHVGRYVRFYWPRIVEWLQEQKESKRRR